MLKFVILQLDYSYLHVACAIFSLTSLAKEYSEHHTYELNGKSDIPSCQNVVSGFFYYLAIILLRLPSLMLLLLLFRYICSKIYIYVKQFYDQAVLTSKSMLPIYLFQVLVFHVCRLAYVVQWNFGFFDSSSVIQQSCMEFLFIYSGSNVLHFQT